MSDGRPGFKVSKCSVLAHYCTIFPCNLGIWKSMTINAHPMNKTKVVELGNKLQVVPSTKCKDRIQSKNTNAFFQWQVENQWIQDFYQKHHKLLGFLLFNFFGSLHMMRRLECSVLRLSRIILGTRSSSHFVSTFILALP